MIWPAGSYSSLPAVILALTLVVGGCTVRSDENEVMIEHLSTQIGVAQMMADSHCGKYDKNAILVQINREQPGFLGIRQRVSLFQCAERVSQ